MHTLQCSSVQKRHPRRLYVASRTQEEKVKGAGSRSEKSNWGSVVPNEGRCSSSRAPELELQKQRFQKQSKRGSSGVSMSEMVKEAAPKELDTALLITAKNPRGIPEVVFIVSGCVSRAGPPPAVNRNGTPSLCSTQ